MSIFKVPRKHDVWNARGEHRRASKAFVRGLERYDALMLTCKTLDSVMTAFESLDLLVGESNNLEASFDATERLLIEASNDLDRLYNQMQRTAREYHKVWRLRYEFLESLPTFGVAQALTHEELGLALRKKGAYTVWHDVAKAELDARRADRKQAYADA